MEGEPVIASNAETVPLPVRTADLPLRLASAAVLLALTGIALAMGGVVLDTFITVVALIALTVGLIIALRPWLTAWGAAGVVVLMLAILALLSARAASRRWNALIAAIDSDRDERP